MAQAPDMSYTTDEIAKLLKISKLTVYDLIKKGELPSYRVGKQMRVDAADLEAYKRRNRTVKEAEQTPLPRSSRAALASPAAFSHGDDRQQAANGLPTEVSPAASQRGAANAESANVSPPASFAQAPRSIVITGQDISLDILARHLEQQAPEFRTLRAHVGSMDSLIRMYKGEADLVSTHLLDGDSGEYNLPYIRSLLVGSPYLVVNLLTRTAGLFVAAGNPLGIGEWADLARPGLRFANREQGSGARVLLDEQLRLHGIPQSSLLGYGDVSTNHLSVAAKVASGDADVGVGTEKAAAIVQGVDFVPLVKERYDLVMLKKPGNGPWIEAVLRILRSESFKRELRSIADYDLSRTGEIIAEA
ncbi:helix-turn-helix transcriptional regulator [Paenibacillus sp. LHD-117]|uniref:helix-turn-helix transcriptional regulator n=1 Tax=Paenibacillus sp. LHD-117 TaxID=3071412 RepID=UPI0027E13D18|nr:helix-turn-helix transcriptional regulator [Paenibacillus sp. LHD-117]MDQ6419630.1 helix-turn-helix transcriptional regulator [Paenibacillus sp. LHD-117]